MTKSHTTRFFARTNNKAVTATGAEIRSHAGKDVINKIQSDSQPGSLRHRLKVCFFPFRLEP